jgi:hypothetical protein
MEMKTDKFEDLEYIFAKREGWLTIEEEKILCPIDI